MNGAPAFALTGVEKRFPGFTLGPIELDLQPGTVLGFVGPNGSGKSTTLGCIAGLVVPEAGSIEVFGRPADPREGAWKADLGVVAETHGFYLNRSVEENLRFLSSFLPAGGATLASVPDAGRERDEGNAGTMLSTLGWFVVFVLVCAEIVIGVPYSTLILAPGLHIGVHNGNLAICTAATSALAVVTAAFTVTLFRRRTLIAR